MSEILYITFTGLASPLGFSQVVRPVCALAERGFRYRILSLESEVDPGDDAFHRRVRAKLDAHGVAWDALPYGPDRVANVRAAVTRALTLPRPRLVHARSYLSGLAALALRVTRRVPYLFDTRGYWVDERLDNETWFTNEPALSAARAAERRLYRNASAIVMLTDVAASDVRHHVFGRWTGAPVRCIPTCVDYDEFAFRVGADLPEEAKPLQDRLVLGHVGSINHAYRIDEMLSITRRVLERREDARFLCLTRQQDEMRAHVERAGIDPARVTVRSVPHDRVAAWLRVMDWGFVLREDTFANRAAMPTKLGEFFATGVRPIAWGGNDDVRRWVQRAGSGLALAELDEETLEATATEVATSEADPATLGRARERTHAHFSLARGVDAYASLLTEVLR